MDASQFRDTAQPTPLSSYDTRCWSSLSEHVGCDPIIPDRIKPDLWFIGLRVNVALLHPPLQGGAPLVHYL